MKATADWFPANERGLAGGVYNIGASVGLDARAAARRLGDPGYNWQFGVRDHRRRWAWSGSSLWLLLYQSPDTHPALSDEERDYITAGQEQHLQGDGKRPVDR